MEYGGVDNWTNVEDESVEGAMPVRTSKAGDMEGTW